MTRKRHLSARTTPKIRLEIQQSAESNNALARRFALNPKTIAKWRSRRTTTDLAMGPKHPTSTVLTDEQETTIVVFRKYTRLRLNDCLAQLRPIIPTLSRSALHRCLKRYGVSRIPKGFARSRPKVEKVPKVDEFAVDIHRVKEGYLFTAISDACLVHAEFKKEASVTSAMSFLEDVLLKTLRPVRSIETKDYTVFMDSDPERALQSAFGPRPFAEFCRTRRIHHFVCKTERREPGPVSKGWGRVLRQRVADRRIEPMYLRAEQPQADHVEMAEIVADDASNWTDAL
jgi:transposase-like protein